MLQKRRNEESILDNCHQADSAVDTVEFESNYDSIQTSDTDCNSSFCEIGVLNQYFGSNTCVTQE
jgi:hypothetical protein